MGNLKTEIQQEIFDLDIFLKTKKPGKENLMMYLRDTHLPFVACYHKELTASECFDLSFRFLQTLGEYNIALAVGICMNQYIAFSIAYLPVDEGSALSTLKHEFLEVVKTKKWILAVSSFDDFIRSKNESSNQVRCFAQDDGTVICGGVKNFQSNISSADVLLFSAPINNEKISLFYILLKDMQGLSLGQPMYKGAMEDADTRSVSFDNVQFASYQMVPVDNESETLLFHKLTRVVFASMAMAPYMGGARRAIQEAIKFMQSVDIGEVALSALDGAQVDMGRTDIKYRVCEGLIERFTNSLEQLSTMEMSKWLEDEMPKVLSAKHHITATCEDIVGYARKVIGTRSLLPNHIISLISSQIIFGALHPVINAKIERDLGMQKLSQ